MLQYREEELDITENTEVFCPYCKSNDLEVDDYNVGMPPMSSWLYVSWICGMCCRSFSTEHELDSKGEIKRE